MRVRIFDPEDSSWFGECGWVNERADAKVFSSKRAAVAMLHEGWCSEQMANRMLVLPVLQRQSPATKGET